MSRNFTRDHLKISVGKILQTLGWNSVNSTSLEILTDIMGNYMSQIAKTTNNYTNEFGCTQPNLDHLGLAFREMGVNTTELEEYVKYVNFAPSAAAVPKYPLPKEDHLNFLKPGSKEVLTRPVHIHEHLPPMNPLLEGDSKSECETVNGKLEEVDENPEVFKKPADIQPDFKRPCLRREEEGSRPTREISSVMMTTSGFLSPAREGKLPESRTPITPVEPPPPPPPVVVNPPPEVEVVKKPRPVKKTERKRKIVQDPLPASEEKPEKKPRPNPVKRVNKSKQQRINGTIIPSDLNISPIPNKLSQNYKINKTLAAARLKTEKLNTTITPITIKPVGDNVDKLIVEPDKKKVNIFKKISNVKNEVKQPKRGDDLKQESRESSPDLIIDEPDEFVAKFNHLSSDVTIEPINPPLPKSRSPEKMDTTFFDDDSQPGTPATPKTPEMISQSPPLTKERRKRKEGRKIKKKNLSPHRHSLDDTIDMVLERPKTPEAKVLTKLDLPNGANPLIPGPMPFPFQFGGPGLIPRPLATNLFAPLPFPTAPFVPPFGNKPISPLQKVEVPLHLEDKPEVVVKNHHVEGVGDTSSFAFASSSSAKPDKKNKEHKKDKKDKIKKRNKKDKVKNKAEKKKLKEEKKEKTKKEKKEKRKEKEMKESDSKGVKITLKLPSPRPETPETTRKLNIKPIVKKEEDEINDRIKREASPGLAKISALVCGPPKPKAATTPQTAEESVQEDIPITPPAPPPRTGPGPGRPRIHPIKPKPTASASKPKKRRSSVKKDEEGKEVWICPSCGRQDDGSPMIGCDDCDAWYHWVCVGIQVPPDKNENWYCRLCLSKKNEDLQSDKQKKKRKKREKKEY